MRKYIAELIGTFALVFIGCGSTVIAGSHIGFAGGDRWSIIRLQVLAPNVDKIVVGNKESMTPG
ncbi:MAG: hypothetical protein A2W25_02505 [candidate division Zixibacteria bacterium RBG_16_53_22]|nr:MAG: hypothetical protein A2W25_02505 [candidate division Zixibacteria bacterium RBG_16_53_22]